MVPQNKYDIIITARIEVVGEYWADTREEAIDAAKLELRPHGEISDITIDRALYVPPADLLEGF